MKDSKTASVFQIDCLKNIHSVETFFIAEVGQSDHFEWGDLGGSCPAPFHEQPVTCFVSVEAGKLPPNHVVPPAQAHVVFTAQPSWWQQRQRKIRTGKTEIHRINNNGCQLSCCHGKAWV